MRSIRALYTQQKTSLPMQRLRLLDQTQGPTPWGKLPKEEVVNTHKT
jgi:hypothetical protein